MFEVLFIIGIVCAVIAVIFLVITIVMFFAFDIITLRKEMSGSLEQKQIEEIRKNNSAALNQRSRINVFEELEKKAKVKRGNTFSLNVGPSTSFSQRVSNDTGTSVLNSDVISATPNFIIEKNIMFVSTNEVM